MIKIVMCDDDMHLINHYRMVFSKLRKTYEFECHFFLNSEELLNQPQIVESMNIIYLDNYMDGLNGIQTAKIIREYNKDVQIIFFSSSGEFVFESFDVNASNYLLKDEINDEIFNKKFAEVFEKICYVKNKRTFTCKEYASHTIIDVDDIIAFEVVSRKLHVYTNHGVYKCYDSIKTINDQFQVNDFYLINRSCLINLRHVKSIDKTEVHMTKNLTFQIAIKKAVEFRRFFAKYLASL